METNRQHFYRLNELRKARTALPPDELNWIFEKALEIILMYESKQERHLERVAAAIADIITEPPRN